MAQALHLISCYLPNDPFVDRFLRETAQALARHDQTLLLLTTYQPADDTLPFVQVPYDLAGFRRFMPAVAPAGFGLLPQAIVAAEEAWQQRPLDYADTAYALGACGAFYGRLLETLQPDSVAVWNPSVPQGRLLQAAARLRGVPCFAIERGVFRETVMIESHEIGAQSDLVLNPALRGLVARQHPRPDRMEELRAYYAARDIARYPAAVLSAAALRQRYDIPPTARVAVLFLSAAAGNWAPADLPASRFASPWFTDATQATAALVASLPEDVWLVVQAHPIDRDRWQAPLHPRVRLARAEHPASLFALGDMFAFLGATTLQHEALWTGKPLLLLARSQLSGVGAAYEFRGDALRDLVERALAHADRSEQQQVLARYIPFLFENVLFGCTGGPARQTAEDLARHLASLASRPTDALDTRIAAWLDAVQRDAAADSPA